MLKLTPRQQAFLDKLFELYREFKQPVHYSIVADKLGVNKFSAYDMLKVLEEKGVAASDYVLSDDQAGPGRSQVVFYPTHKAAQFLTQLRDEGHRLAVCSNGPAAYVHEFLDAHKVRSFFDEVRFRGTTFAGKSAMIAAVLAQIPVRPAVVIGDRADDIEGAHQHGAWAVGATYGFGAPGELDAADALVDCAADIPSAVRRLLASAS